jgi:hypothetical protein
MQRNLTSLSVIGVSCPQVLMCELSWFSAMGHETVKTGYYTWKSFGFWNNGVRTFILIFIIGKTALFWAIAFHRGFFQICLLLAGFVQFLYPRAVTSLCTPSSHLSWLPPLFILSSDLASRILFSGRCWSILKWPAHFNVPTLIKVVIL